MAFTTEMARARAIRGFKVPLMDRELLVTTIDNEPVHRARGHDAADFTPEFILRRHKDGFSPAGR